jgi:hypothetical protein
MDDFGLDSRSCPLLKMLVADVGVGRGRDKVVIILNGSVDGEK